jgi:hypothetical protein
MWNNKSDIEKTGKKNYQPNSVPFFIKIFNYLGGLRIFPLF